MNGFTFLTDQMIRQQLVDLKQLTFEVTDACNLRCEYCGYGKFYNDYDKRIDTNLPVDKAIAIIEYLADLWEDEKLNIGNRHVYIGFYGGEPLLNIEFVEKIINYIGKRKIKNRKIGYSMTTNAMLLDKHMDMIVENDFSLLISLDGNENNHSYRVDKSGRNSFERVVKNINILKNKYPDFFDKKVNFNAVLHNRSTFEEVYNYIKNEFGKIPSITELNNSGIREDMKDEFDKTYKNSYESLMQSEHYDDMEKEMFIRSGSYQSVTTFLHQYSSCVFKDYNELLYGKYEEKRIPTGTCMPFSRRMFVTVNGKILPCERIGQQFAMGEINDNNEVNIDYKKIADKHNEYLKKISPQCSTCKAQKTCIQCVYNLEDLDGKPVCKGYTTEEEFQQYVASQVAFLEKHPEDYYRIMKEIIVE